MQPFEKYSGTFKDSASKNLSILSKYATHKFNMPINRLSPIKSAQCKILLISDKAESALE